MEIILVSKTQTYRLPIGLANSILAGLFFLLLAAGLFYTGKEIASNQHEFSYSVLHEQKESKWRQELRKQQAAANQIKIMAENSLDALATRLSKLQAHLLRLDALGAHLTNITDISDSEFDFLSSPGMGGPSPNDLQKSLGVVDFIEELDNLSRKIEDRQEKLTAMQTVLMDLNIQNQILPEGNPVADGWLSSLFGWRTDPITGKRSFHRGIDIVSKSGALVSSAAAGIVTWSSPYFGYGNMVEVNHGNGYITRYAHNRKNLVAVGDKVEKGQNIAVMGASGRSTGNHVHFEVLHNGKNINPKQFVPIN